jgi:hypothetical protein
MIDWVAGGATDEAKAVGPRRGGVPSRAATADISL